MLCISIWEIALNAAQTSTLDALFMNYASSIRIRHNASNASKHGLYNCARCTATTEHTDDDVDEVLTANLCPTEVFVFGRRCIAINNSTAGEMTFSVLVGVEFYSPEMLLGLVFWYVESVRSTHIVD